MDLAEAEGAGDGQSAGKEAATTAAAADRDKPWRGWRIKLQVHGREQLTESELSGKGTALVANGGSLDVRDPRPHGGSARGSSGGQAGLGSQPRGRRTRSADNRVGRAVGRGERIGRDNGSRTSGGGKEPQEWSETERRVSKDRGRSKAFKASKRRERNGPGLAARRGERGTESEHGWGRPLPDSRALRVAGRCTRSKR